MRTEIKKVLSMNKFFNVTKSTDHGVQYNLRKPSILLINNVYYNWLHSIYSKTHKHVTIFTNKEFYKNNDKPNLPYGYLENKFMKYTESTVIEQHATDLAPKNMSHLSLNIMIPKQESMQYFIQWQRYRKYWWSSITTTPSLFAINEINYNNDTADSNIVANFPTGKHAVETITVNSKDSDHNVSCLTCSTSLECALFILLLDGLGNRTKEYLRLHRTMASYKISFVLDIEDEVNKQMLCKLANLMYHQLQSKNISSFLPNFSLSKEQQIINNLQLGVPYAAVLCNSTLTNGIFNLLNSSTMLKEQVHLSDFEAYADLLCK